MSEMELKPKSVGAYLNENALANLEFIQRYFKRVGYNPSNSGIIQSSLSIYARFLDNYEKNKPICPKCHKEIMAGDPECPHCNKPLRWMIVEAREEIHKTRAFS